MKQLVFRGFILAIIAPIYFYDWRILEKYLTHPILFKFKLFHLVWLVTVIFLIRSMLPWGHSMASGKIFKKYFRPRNFKELKNTEKHSSKKVQAVFWIWLAILAVYWTSIYSGLIPVHSVLVVVPFIYFMDAFCVQVWCPFKKFILNNKCCNNCRIYHWGYWMYATPLFVVPSFWTGSIVALAWAILFQWEYLCYKHPERIVEKSNSSLQCRHCTKATGKCYLASRNQISNTLPDAQF